MAEELRLICPVATNSKMVLPPNGETISFDEQGISEPVSREVHETCLTVSGFSAHVGGYAPGPADGTIGEPGTKHGGQVYVAGKWQPVDSGNMDEAAEVPAPGPAAVQDEPVAEPGDTGIAGHIEQAAENAAEEITGDSTGKRKRS